MARLLLSISVLGSVLTAQITFQRTYGGPLSEVGFAVAQTADGGYVVAGRTSSFGVDSGDAWLVRTDSLGDTLWTRTYGGPRPDEARSVASTRDGGFIIAGTTESFGAGEMDAWLIRTDASGDTLWTRTFGGPDDDEARSVAQTEDGGFIIAGSIRERAWLIKTNAAGIARWARSYGDRSSAHAVAQTRDGGYILAGDVWSFHPTDGNFWLVRTDAAGDTMWTRSLGGSSQDAAYSVAQTSDGGYIVVGGTWSFGAGNGGAWLVKTDSSGDTMWTRLVDDSPSEWARSVAQTPDGGYVITGYACEYVTNNANAWLIRTDASGDTMWTRTFGGENTDTGWSVASTPDGGYILTGYTSSVGAGSADAWLIKTDSLGRVGIAEPKPPAPVTPAGASLLPRARLLSELRQTPDLALFDASGRRVLDPTAITAGILFLRSAATTRRVLVVE